MAGSTEAYVGIDAAKTRNAVAVAEEGRDGEVRHLGEFDATPEGMRRLVARPAAKYGRVRFCLGRERGRDRQLFCVPGTDFLVCRPRKPVV